MRILFITSTRVGDAVLSTGLLSHLRDAHPDARWTIAAGSSAIGLFEAVPNLERLIPINKEPMNRHWIKLWRRCAARRWDIVVDLRRSAISWLLKAKQRYVVPKIDTELHRVELLGATMGLRDTPPSPRLFLDDRHRTAARELIGNDLNVLALAPAANWPGKQWRSKRFLEVATRLTADAGCLPGGRVAVFAAEAERDQIKEVLSDVPQDRLIDTVGKLDLLTIAACLERCALFIGNDSGLMHMAAAAGAPTLGLFGPSRQEHYAPWGKQVAWVRTPESFDDLTGAPDYDHRTTGTLMDGLTVKQVEQAATALWQRSRQGVR